jgi:hypothetical protein
MPPGATVAMLGDLGRNGGILPNRSLATGLVLGRAARDGAALPAPFSALPPRNVHRRRAKKSSAVYANRVDDAVIAPRGWSSHYADRHPRAAPGERSPVSCALGVCHAETGGAVLCVTADGVFDWRLSQMFKSVAMGGIAASRFLAHWPIMRIPWRSAIIMPCSRGQVSNPCWIEWRRARASKISSCKGLKSDTWFGATLIVTAKCKASSA